jgi:hypothetical protein
MGALVDAEAHAKANKTVKPTFFFRLDFQPLSIMGIGLRGMSNGALAL